ncbi:hypothetical protein PHMEG_00036444 [Phytophthora megakarya]|uniref:Uncharacterized protein n=1 Tax=Phytophthora megakarya TaxID=4795 RepID=A0A225ULY8_9STRA|nr:hypothetical protein PHMEG_00036444 [Phytophthora megakarya]
MQTPSSAQETVDLTAVDGSGASENPVTPNLVKLYVDDQVRRWEQVSLEFVMSPTIEVAEELQHLLTVELLEWQQVTSQCRVVSPLDGRNLNDHSEEMKPEDVEGDPLMSSYEADTGPYLYYLTVKNLA